MSVCIAKLLNIYAVYVLSCFPIFVKNTIFILIVSEVNEEYLETELQTDIISFDITGACYSVITCLAVKSMESLERCAVYCGISANLTSLSKSGSATGTGNSDITVRLPPVVGEEYHCIVSGISEDGSILFRVRTVERKFGERSIYKSNGCFR